MGFFDSALTPVSALEPLTIERLRAALTRMELNCEEENGNLITHFEQGYFFFLSANDGQALNVRGTWRRSLPLHCLEAARSLTESWNRDMMFPKTYTLPLRHSGSELTLLVAEIALPTASGLTDDQLEEIIGVGISTGLRFFEVATRELEGAV